MKRMPKWLLAVLLISIVLGCGDGNSNDDEDVNDDNEVAQVAYAMDSGAYLQFRSFDDSALNDYQAWLPMMHDDLPIQELDVVGFRVLDPFDMIVPVSSTGFKSLKILAFDCVAEQHGKCVGNVIERNGYFAAFTTLSPGTYTFEVDVLDGSTLAVDFLISEVHPLPVVDQSSMQAQRYDGTLEFSWELPVDAPNWNRIDQVGLIFYDSTGNQVFSLRGNQHLANVDLSEKLFAFCAAIGDGTVTHWQVQTLSFDENNVNSDAGFSGLQLIPSEEEVSEPEEDPVVNTDGDTSVSW